VRACLQNVTADLLPLLHCLNSLSAEGNATATGLLGELADVKLIQSLFLYAPLIDQLGKLNNALQASDLVLADVSDLVEATSKRLKDAYEGPHSFAKKGSTIPHGILNPWAPLHKLIDFGTPDSLLSTNDSGCLGVMVEASLS
jgi:hypothetical protein